MSTSRGFAIVVGTGDSVASGKGDATFLADANAMSDFVESVGFQLMGKKSGAEPEQKPFLGKDATKEEIKRTISHASSELSSSDILLVFFSGHGAQVDWPGTVPPPPQARDGVFEGWALNGELLMDYEWRDMLRAFAPGVRVLVITDSCFSGGFGPRETDPDAVVGFGDPGCQNPRFLSKEVANGMTTDTADDILGFLAGGPIKARVLLLAACQANQVACTDDSNGLFTKKLLDVANRFPERNYKELHSAVVAQFPGTQSPRIWWAGRGSVAFRDQAAFSIGEPGDDGDKPDE